ncbi:antitoxin [Corynebacterium phoceense]|uniref:antitoxin n=1 Tax=Corynebacterium phoceense TaxID=1686286 RepID=UPI0034CE5992
MGIFDKAKDALNSDKGEQISDQALDKGAEFATGKLGENKADQIDSARDKADEHIGKQGE